MDFVKILESVILGSINFLSLVLLKISEVVGRLVELSLTAIVIILVSCLIIKHRSVSVFLTNILINI